jgi:hypothetical protein
MAITTCVRRHLNSTGCPSTANLLVLTANLTASSTAPTTSSKDSNNQQHNEERRGGPATNPTSRTAPTGISDPSKSADPIGRRGTLSGFAGTAHRGGNGLACGAAAGTLHPSADRPLPRPGG